MSPSDPCSSSPASPSPSGETGSGEHHEIATEITFATFELPDTSGDFVGIDMDLLAAIAEREGFTCTLRPLGFNAAIQANQVGGMIAGMTITDEREKVVDFSDPYVEPGAEPGARRDVERGPRGAGDDGGHVLPLPPRHPRPRGGRHDDGARDGRDGASREVPQQVFLGVPHGGRVHRGAGPPSQVFGIPQNPRTRDVLDKVL